jgi:hypothetical protein
MEINRIEKAEELKVNQTFLLEIEGRISPFVWQWKGEYGYKISNNERGYLITRLADGFERILLPSDKVVFFSPIV